VSVSVLAALLLAVAADAGPDAGAEDGLPSIGEGEADAGLGADAARTLVCRRMLGCWHRRRC